MNTNDTTTSETTSTSAGYDDPTVYDRSDLDEFKGKVQKVADDDSLSASEKADEFDRLRGEEEKEIRVAYGAEPDVASAPEGDTNNVTGDPLSASYGTATTPVEEPVTLASDDATSDVAGDTVYSEVDGTSTVTRYDDEGNIVLVQQDTDGNGSYETSAELANGIVKVSVDSDGDYRPDQVNYLDAATGQILQQDTLVDGKVTKAMVDNTGDGYSEANFLDTTGDGHFDTLEIDSDGDHITNTELVYTEDGTFAKGATDADNNISLETTFTSDEVELPNIGELEAVLPSTQFDAPVEPEPAYEPEPASPGYDSYDQV